MSCAPNIGISDRVSFLVAGLVLGLILALSPLAGHAQELTFSFQVTLDGETSDPRQFGLRETALPGFDTFDVPEPPPAPSAGFDAYLAMFEPPESLPNRWRRDFRPSVSLMADRVELWQMHLQSDAVGSTATLTIDTEGTPPVPYQLFLFGPGVEFEPILVPDSVTIPITATNLVFFWELRLADEVDTVPVSWGGVKSVYR